MTKSTSFGVGKIDLCVVKHVVSIGICNLMCFLVTGTWARRDLLVVQFVSPCDPKSRSQFIFGFDNSYNPGQAMFHNSKVHARVDLWQNVVSYKSNVHNKTAEINIKEKTHTKDVFIAPSSGFTCFLFKTQLEHTVLNSGKSLLGTA